MAQNLLLIALGAVLFVACLVLAFVGGYLVSDMSRRNRRRRNRYALAVHEAGHAVLAWKSTLDLELVSVTAPLGQGPRQGQVCFQPSANQTGPAYKLDMAILYVAGRAAEDSLCGRIQRTNNRSDRNHAKRLVEEVANRSRYTAGFLMGRVIRRCQRLIRLYRPEIEQVAQALLARRHLTSADLKEILGPRPHFPQTP